jgi:hypothetical protein
MDEFKYSTFADIPAYFIVIRIHVRIKIFYFLVWKAEKLVLCLIQYSVNPIIFIWQQGYWIKRNLLCIDILPKFASKRFPSCVTDLKTMQTFWIEPIGLLNLSWSEQSTHHYHLITTFLCPISHIYHNTRNITHMQYIICKCNMNT